MLDTFTGLANRVSRGFVAERLPVASRVVHRGRLREVRSAGRFEFRCDRRLRGDHAPQEFLRSLVRFASE